MHSTALLRLRFYDFSLFEGIGARTVRIPTRFDVCPIPLENMGIELGAICIYATGDRKSVV